MKMFLYGLCVLKKTDSAWSGLASWLFTVLFAVTPRHLLLLAWAASGWLATFLSSRCPPQFPLFAFFFFFCWSFCFWLCLVSARVCLSGTVFSVDVCLQSLSVGWHASTNAADTCLTSQRPQAGCTPLFRSNNSTFYWLDHHSRCHFLYNPPFPALFSKVAKRLRFVSVFGRVWS